MQSLPDFRIYLRKTKWAGDVEVALLLPKSNSYLQLPLSVSVPSSGTMHELWAECFGLATKPVTSVTDWP